MVDILECPVCTNKNLRKFIRCKDYTVSHETFDVQLCSSCQFGITTPRPETQKLASYYQSEEYISHSGKSSGGLGFVYRAARSYSLRWKKRIISQYRNKGNALDFGCGTGEFLECLTQSGWSVAGVEPASQARLKSEKLIGHSIHASADALPANTFDIITAWHVVEHVPDLRETLATLKRLLKKDGTIFIAVPNYQSPDAVRYQEHWAGYDVPRHLWHFSKQSMEIILKEIGLTVIEIVPMKLDAYYVSMLSEKYRNNNQLSLFALAKGFISGFNSNLTARKKNNYSSLIYIAQKT